MSVPNIQMTRNSEIPVNNEQHPKRRRLINRTCQVGRPWRCGNGKASRNKCHRCTNKQQKSSCRSFCKGTVRKEHGPPSHSVFAEEESATNLRVAMRVQKAIQLGFGKKTMLSRCCNNSNRRTVRRRLWYNAHARRRQSNFNLHRTNVLGVEYSVVPERVVVFRNEMLKSGAGGINEVRFAT